MAADSGVVVKSGWNAPAAATDTASSSSTVPGAPPCTATARLNVSVGQSVEKGQVIATVGNTGYRFGNHLHFEMTQSGYRRDIREFFDRSTIRYNPA